MVGEPEGELRHNETLAPWWWKALLVAMVLGYVWMWSP